MSSVDIREGIGTPKSGRGRTVPMADDVAQTLASRLNRDRFTGPDDLVFPNEVGRWIDGSALRRRYKDAQSRAALRLWGAKNRAPPATRIFRERAPLVDP
jgi:hypothetical protein